MDRVLVTGGTGFTGSHLVRSLTADGHEVRVLTRAPERGRKILPAEVELVQGDIADPAAVARAVDGREVVFHLATTFREANLSEARHREVHVNGTRFLLEAARRAGVRRFVHCSTVGVFSHIRQAPADESQPYNPSDVYQLTKCEGERLAMAFQRRHGFPLAVARPTAIYGPGDTRLLKLFRLAVRRPSIVLGNGKNYYHLVHVEDLVRGLRLLATEPRAVGEDFILGGEGYSTLDEIADSIAAACGVRRVRVHLPVWPFQLAASACEAVCPRLGVSPPIYHRRVDFFTKSRAFSIEKARRLLAYRPRVGLREGIRSTAEWYAAEGLLPRRLAAVAS
jgi:nucleoside-diphosphate-sugar epimerase